MIRAGEVDARVISDDGRLPAEDFVVRIRRAELRKGPFTRDTFMFLRIHIYLLPLPTFGIRVLSLLIECT